MIGRLPWDVFDPFSPTSIGSATGRALAGYSNAYTNRLRLYSEDTVGSGTLTEKVVSTTKAVNFEITIDYAHPTICTFEVKAAQHTQPIKRRARIIVNDPLFGGTGTETPLFEGVVWEVIPKDHNTVAYTCYDATRRTIDEVPVMSGSWDDGSPPTEGAGTIPRLVYNAKIDNDDDAAVHRRDDADIEQILTDLFDDATPKLRYHWIGPPTGSVYGTTPYIPEEIDGLDVKPQGKVVFESMSFRAAIDQMIQYYPGRRIWFEPGSARRKWHFYNVLASPTKTITLNYFPGNGRWPNYRWPLKMELNVSTDQRWTAVEIFGPPHRTVEVATLSDDELTEEWTNEDETEALVYTGTPQQLNEDATLGDAFKKYRIADSAKRRMARLLPDEVAINAPQMFGSNLAFTFTKDITLQVKWFSTDEWQPVNKAKYDLDQGYINLPYRLMRPTQTGASSYEYDEPFDVQLTYAYLTTPLTARYPASSYSGTAYTSDGIANKKNLYDENLCVGYEDGNPVTTSEREAEYDKIAQAIQESRRDIIHAGGMTIMGMDYEWARLNRRLNITAVDTAGDPLTTGWEAMNAPVTGVVYNFTNQTTTLTFNGDLLEFMAGDIDTMKARLNINTDIYRLDRPNKVVLNIQGASIDYFATPQSQLDISAGYEQRSEEMSRPYTQEEVY